MGSLNLIQSAVGDFLSTGKYRQHVNKMRRVYQYNVRQFSNLLSLALNRYDDLEEVSSIPTSRVISHLVDPAQKR